MENVNKSKSTKSGNNTANVDFYSCEGNEKRENMNE